jgi:hypothetical protein
MSEAQPPIPPYDPAAKPHQRRPRYRGTHPRRFEEKYKELNPDRYTDAVAKVMASGKTPAGSHRAIMVAEILEVLAPQPGEIAVDATLGYGGHRRRKPGYGRWVLARRFSPRTAAISPDCPKYSRKSDWAARTSSWPISASPRCRSMIPRAASR